MINTVSGRAGRVVAHVALLGEGADPVAASSDHQAGIRRLQVENRVLMRDVRNALSRDCLIGPTG